MHKSSGFYGTGWLSAAALIGTLALLLLAGGLEGWQPSILGGFMFELFIFSALLGLIPALIASKKGRSFGLWWLYGALLFIIALVHSLLISEDAEAAERRQLDQGMVKCPSCAEVVKSEAVVCKHCGRDIPA